MSKLRVIVPTRGRRKRCAELLESFERTRKFADIVFVLDPDDKDTYDGMDWRSALAAEVSPRMPLTGKLNTAAMAACDEGIDAVMFAGDDHYFITEGWDEILMKALADMGGSGMVYPDDKKRADIPESVVMSTDMVKVLGHFAEPTLSHYYIDNVWGDLGKRASLLRYVPEAVVEHRHYQVDPNQEHDETYRSAEAMWGVSDFEAFQRWRAGEMAHQVAKLRRHFNTDVSWVLGSF